ncbi:helix-turn-helix transcriptional regulator [Clostridioides difficile]
MRSKLKQLRIKKNLTHKVMAKELGISRSYYTLIEMGNKTPSLKTSMKIKSFLKYYKDDIFLDDKVSKRNNLD